MPKSKWLVGVSALAGLVAALGISATPLQSQTAVAGLPSLAEPGISPDGATIAFVSGGDIWTVPAEGGAARLLVAHSANDSRPLYAPDRTRIAFNSDREGSQDVYVMDLGTGEVARLTHSSGAEELNGWSRDGAWIYFSSSEEDISGMHDVFRVRADGGTPFAVAGDRYETEFFAAAGPGADVLAVSTRGNMARHQWWRNGHSHIDEAEIWLVRMGELPEYSPLTSEGKNVWPMWGPGDEQIFFVSDRSGSENLWSVPVDGREASRLTSFSGGRVLWPTIAVERPVIAFERGFGNWTYDVESETLRELDIRLMGSVEAPRPELRQATDGFDELALSPDGEKLALTVRGEVFAAPAEDDVPAVRVSVHARRGARRDVVARLQTGGVRLLAERDPASLRVRFHDGNGAAAHRQ